MHELAKTNILSDDRARLPSASSFRRFELCAGSWQLEQKARELNQEACQRSEAALTGDRIHEWLAHQRAELDPDELKTAEFLKERADDQIARIFGDARVDILVEKRLWLELDGKPALSGRFDRVVWAENKALLIDFKSGFSEPDPAEQNSQLKVLAVLFALNFRSVQEVIVQLSLVPTASLRRATISRSSRAPMKRSSPRCKPLTIRTRAFNPSPEACRYCPAKLICQALKDTILPVAKAQYSELPLEPSRAAKLLDEVAVIKGHIAEIEKFYFQRLSEDPAFRIPGYALVPGVVRRDVTDWHSARQRLAEFIDEKDLRDAETYQLGDLEKALGRRLKLKAKEAKAKLNEILAGLIEEKQNAPSLRRVRGESKVALLPHE